MSREFNLDDIIVYCCYINHEFYKSAPVRAQLATLQPMIVGIRINDGKVIGSETLEGVIKEALLYGSSISGVAKSAIKKAIITNIGIMNELLPVQKQSLEVVLAFHNYTGVEAAFNQLKKRSPTSFQMDINGHSFTYTQNFSETSELKVSDYNRRLGELVTQAKKKNKGFLSKIFS
jgi:hypothetical protein